MAINIQKVGIFGAIVGLITTWLMDIVIVPVLDIIGGFAPDVSLKLANPGTISVNVRESLNGVDGGLAGWFVDAVGLNVTGIPGSTYLMAALGGALFMVAGAFLADWAGFLKGNVMQKTRATIFGGSLVTAAILGWAVNGWPNLNISFLNVLIAMAINAAIWAWIYVGLANAAKQPNLLPF